MFTGPKWNQVFSYFQSQKARHSVTFLNETTPTWWDSNRRKHLT